MFCDFESQTNRVAATSRPKPSANTPKNTAKLASAIHHQSTKPIPYHSSHDVMSFLCTLGGSLLFVDKRWSHVVEICSLVFCPNATPTVSCRFFNRFCNVHVTPYRAAAILTFCWDGDDADSMALRFAWMTAARLIFLFMWDPLDSIWFDDLGE